MEQLSGLDTAFLSLETPQAPMHVGGLTLLDLSHAPRGFGFDTVRARVAERLPLLPSFRRRLVGMPLNLIPPLWIEDPEFRLSRHLHRVRLKRPGSDRQLAQWVAEIISRPLPRAQPLWAFYYIEGLSQRRAACLTLVHHACIDGVSGAELLGKLLDLAPITPRTPPVDGWDYDELPSGAQRLVFTVRQGVHRLGHFAALLHDTAPLALQFGRSLFGAVQGAQRPVDGGGRGVALRPAPRTRFNVAIDASRAYVFRSLSLARIKALKNALGITVNDVLLALCAGALRRYLSEKGELPAAPLVAAVPVSVRAPEARGAGGNQVIMLTASLPTPEADPLARAAAVARSTARLKQAHRAIPAKLLMDWMELPAPALLGRAARLYENFVNRDRFNPLVNLVISNVPGPSQTLYLAGAPVLANYPVSIPYHGLALNITVLSYRDQLDVGLTACRRAVPDLGRLMDMLAQELDMLESALRTAVHSSGPGTEAPSGSGQRTDGARRTLRKAAPCHRAKL